MLMRIREASSSLNLTALQSFQIASGVLSRELGAGVARTMQHANDDDFSVRESVVDCVITIKVNPKTGTKFVAPGAYFGT
jgi:hypothetical protein